MGDAPLWEEVSPCEGFPFIGEVLVQGASSVMSADHYYGRILSLEMRTYVPL